MACTRATSCTMGLIWELLVELCLCHACRCDPISFMLVSTFTFYLNSSFVAMCSIAIFLNYNNMLHHLYECLSGTYSRRALSGCVWSYCRINRSNGYYSRKFMGIQSKIAILMWFISLVGCCAHQNCDCSWGSYCIFYEAGDLRVLGSIVEREGPKALLAGVLPQPLLVAPYNSHRMRWRRISWAIARRW